MFGTLGKITVAAELAKRGCQISPNNVCHLCNLEQETISHIFCNCPVSWRLWGCHYGARQNGLDAFPGSSAFVQDPSLFQEVITTKKDTHKNIWLPPPLGSVKFNVDGAVCGGGVGSAGIWGILRDSYNRTLILFSKAARNADATSVELFAIREACFLFQASPWSSSNNLINECDCFLVVEWFHCSSKAPVIFKQIILECFTICERCSWRICATSRSCNATADKLAKQGINRAKDMYVRDMLLPLRLSLGDGLKWGLAVFNLIM
ncbi:hypothetical protein GQ457_12G000900 [Hibiscus cannabinus]